MEDIFEIKFPIELDIKEKVITKFSNKQGGAYNIFSYYWQCFVWAATIGFLRNERRPLASGTERIFSLNTMKGNGGEKDAQALICMCIARIGSIDIMKEPVEAIQIISEYANGGFYHIMQLMENGENTFNDFEKVKQEIFSRDYWSETQVPKEVPQIAESEEFEVPEAFFSKLDNTIEFDEEAILQAEKDFLVEKPKAVKVRQRWTTSQCSELKSYYKQGLTIEQLANFFNRSEENIREQLEKLGVL